MLELIGIENMVPFEFQFLQLGWMLLYHFIQISCVCYTTGPNTFNENETIAKFEIMDGAPVRGESIPIRLFLNGYELTPTMRDINKKFSVRYYLNLVLVDEEDRRYFKQQVCIPSLEDPTNVCLY